MSSRQESLQVLVDGGSDLKEICGVFAGAVSACWSDLSEAGEFDSSAAAEWVDAFCAVLQQILTQRMENAGYDEASIDALVKDIF